MAPRKVWLFSGHMIDAPGRAEPRFPARAEPIARDAIERTLDVHDAGPDDLGVSGGACGGDLLFVESALARGVRMEMYLPFQEPAFIATSVEFAGPSWRERFGAVAARSSLHVMPVERGPLPQGADPYELNNLWMLEAASRFGPELIDFVCLWDGRGGDGRGGAEHLWKTVERRGGRAHWLDTTKLW